MLVALAMLLAIDPPVDPPPHTYLRGAESRRPCGERHDGGEIVVCGRGSEGERIRPGDDATYAERPVRAVAGLGGGATLALHNQAASVGGFTSNRAMATLSIPLGGRK